MSYGLKHIAVRITAEADEDITEDDLIQIITKVADIHKGKAFAYFEMEDIKSEVWVICLNQLQFYEPERALGTSVKNSIERWLNRVTKNRLANLYRDKYSSVNQKYRQARMNIINSLPFDLIDTSRESGNWGYRIDPIESLHEEEFLDFIKGSLDDELLQIFQDCLSEENVTPYYKGKLRIALGPILQKWEEIDGELDGEEID